MDLSTVLAYFSIAITTISIGVAAFLLFPVRRDVSEPAADATLIRGNRSESSTSLRDSLVAAAPRGYIGWIEKQIVLAGRPLGWTLQGTVTWKLVLAVTSAALGLLFVAIGGPQPFKIVMVIFAVALAFFAPDVLINSRAHDRQKAILYALPDTLDQMTIAVEAGLGFDSAMAKAARGGEGPLAEELIRVLQDMSIGRTRRDAFKELESRTSSEDLRRFTRAIIQADAYGVAIGDVLRVQAGEMRTKRRQRAEEQAQKVTVKIIFPLIFCLLPVMFIVILLPPIMDILETFAGTR